MMISLLLAILSVAWGNDEPAWSKEVAVLRDGEAIVRFQARIVDNYLLVKATHQAGWHTYAMDNEMRAAKALQGKKSLGIEQGLEIKVESGLELDANWLQTKPKDLSKPELRWFTYGFDNTALFARHAKAVTAEQAVLHIKGQACSGETCCLIDVTLKLQTANQASASHASTQEDRAQSMLKDLVLKGLVSVPAGQAGL